MLDIFRGVLDPFELNEKDEDRAEGGRDGVDVFGCNVEMGVIFFGEAGGVDFGDRPNNPFFGKGGAVSICKGSILIALDTDAENDLDRGLAAKNPGLGPADESSVCGDVTLRWGYFDGARRVPRSSGMGGRATGIARPSGVMGDFLPEGKPNPMLGNVDPLAFEGDMPGTSGPPTTNVIGTGPFAAPRSIFILPTSVNPRGRLPSGVLLTTSTACLVAAIECGEAGDPGVQAG